MYFCILTKYPEKLENYIIFNFTMTQTSMNTPYAKRVAEKFKEAQNYLKTNGFSRSTNHLLKRLRILLRDNVLIFPSYFFSI